MTVAGETGREALSQAGDAREVDGREVDGGEIDGGAAAHAELVARKRRLLRHYDVLGMDEVVTITAWGRSASLLLASYLDGHSHVLMLQQEASERIPRFFEATRDLSLRERLLAYPAHTDAEGHPFFHGEFAIAEPDYRAAVDALMAEYGDRPAEVLASHRTFFQCVYAAYNMARDHRPAVPRPLLVYFQHHRSDALAQYLLRDFPKTRFLHTIRHPIACFRSSVDRSLYMGTADGQLPQRGYLRAALSLAVNLTEMDHPHEGAGERTRAVRFEDMQTEPAATMRSVAAWLGLPWRPSLTASTFNGVPYVVERAGADWVGSQPGQGGNPLRGVTRWDRAVLYALFHEDFVAWDYPVPARLRAGWRRWAVALGLAAVPMALERLVARAVWRVQVMPALRQRDYGLALRMARRPLACHIALAAHVAAVLRQRRRSGGTPGFEILRPMAGAVHVQDIPAAVPPAVRAGDGRALTAALLSRYCAAGPAMVRGDGEQAALMPADAATVGAYAAEAVERLRPLAGRIRRHIAAAELLYAADLPVAVQTTEQPKQGRVWIYVRDRRAEDPCPAVGVFHSAERSAAVRSGHLPGFAGLVQTCSVLEPPRDEAASGAIIDVASWTRCRSKFAEMPTPCNFPMIKQVLDRLDRIFAIDAETRHLPLADRRVRREPLRALAQELFRWSAEALGRIDRRSGLAAAFRHLLDRQASLVRVFEHGAMDFENAAILRTIGDLSWHRDVWTGSDGQAGGERAAVAYTVIESARLNGLDVAAYLRDVLSCPSTDAEPLLPWAYGRMP